jgi:hypothetical protein
LATASAAYKESIVDQLKHTAMHTGFIYVSHPPQAVEAKLASGVLSQDVSNGF